MALGQELSAHVWDNNHKAGVGWGGVGWVLISDVLTFYLGMHGLLNLKAYPQWQTSCSKTMHPVPSQTVPPSWDQALKHVHQLGVICTQTTTGSFYQKCGARCRDAGRAKLRGKEKMRGGGAKREKAEAKNIREIAHRRQRTVDYITKYMTRKE